MKAFRIGFLLLVLVVVAGTGWLSRIRTAQWEFPLVVVILPINGDRSEVATRYIADLDQDVFQPVAAFMSREGTRYGLSLDRPVSLELAPEVKGALPPSPPVGGTLLAIMAWSLKLRWWAWRANTYDGPWDARVFIAFFDPATHDSLSHSIGIREGMIGMVNGFAERRQAGGNNVIIVHELLHTLGATDKYDLKTDLPLYPLGYADPSSKPLYPQKKAEIMGGVIPLSDHTIRMPEDLGETLVGYETAREIGWL
ncbi:MAG: hypothetical protein KJ950_11750 [Proteobacteria bacterium]|nr:hypothetical protein [Pseudomonadota bacterium]MBU1688015.1 hypothetical protein [Pseudomonadota bacterium]